MNHLFTADFHLGHANIIKHCNRILFMNANEKNIMKNGSEKEIKQLIISPKSVNKMIKAIIDRHNERVKKNDIVYFIGDFCFRNSKGGKEGEGIDINAETYIKKLNGRFVFIKGNHDNNNSLKTKLIRGVLHFGGLKINMVHDPKYANPKYDLNLCGHVHNSFLIREIKTKDKKSLIINVGVDLNNFYPYTFDEIIKIYNSWKRGKRGQEKKKNN